MKTSFKCIALKVIHFLVNGIAALLFLFCLSYALYGLWDTFDVLGAPDRLKSELEEYRPDRLMAELKAHRPDSAGEEADALKPLKALNPDVCGWLTVPGTNIDYPVVQGRDNFEYLNRDVLGKETAAGSIFLDCENHRDFTDFYTILMGHHMQGGKMFGDVALFAEEAFFRENTKGTVILDGRVLNLETAAFVSADAYDRILYRVEVESREGKKALVERIKETALYTNGGELTGEEPLLALSTCSTEYTNARYLLIFRVTEGRQREAPA